MGRILTCYPSPTLREASESNSSAPSSEASAEAQAIRGFLETEAAGFSSDGTPYSALGSSFFTLVDLSFLGPEPAVCPEVLRLRRSRGHLLGRRSIS